MEKGFRLDKIKTIFEENKNAKGFLLLQLGRVL